MRDHDIGTDFLPVYHTLTTPTPPEPGKPEADDLSPDWVRFGRAVLETHQPEGNTCQGCGRIWISCPVVVAARQNGLGDELILTGSLTKYP